MTRPIPPDHHTRKLRELLVAHLLDLAIGHHVDPRIIRPLRTWGSGMELPHGTVAAYLRLRGYAPTSIGGHNTLSALSAALHGRRACPLAKPTHQILLYLWHRQPDGNWCPPRPIVLRRLNWATGELL